MSSAVKSSLSSACALALASFLWGCGTAGAADTTTASAQCSSKWVAAGNNGAKADRYYRPHCE